MLNTAEQILAASPGKTELLFMGQAGFVVKSASGTTLGIDLYLSDCVERCDGFKRLCPPVAAPQDLVLDGLIATHAHWDHFDVDALPLLMEHPKTRLYASVGCEGLVRKLRVSQARTAFVRPWDRISLKDIDILFIPCDHGASAPDAVGALVQVDGFRIYIAGDTRLHQEWAEQWNATGPIDIAILPINGAFGNMNEQDAVTFCSLLQPKLVIPCHYWTFAEHHGDPGLFQELMGLQCPKQQYLLMAPGEYCSLPYQKGEKP